MKLKILDLTCKKKKKKMKSIVKLIYFCSEINLTR